MFAEILLTLLHQHRVVEVPRLRLLCRLWAARRVGHTPIVVVLTVFISARIGRTVAAGAFGRFLLLSERFYDAVDGSITLFLAHQRQSLEGILQLNGRSIGHEFIQHP